jgi:hypothetical protein
MLLVLVVATWREEMAEAAARPEAGRRRERARAVAAERRRRAAHPQQLRPPAEAQLQRGAKGIGVDIGRGDEAVGLYPRELHHPPAGIDRPPGLLAVEHRELARPVREHRARGAAAAPRAHVLEAVLGDRVARRASLTEPANHLGRALTNRMQIAHGNDEQRDAVDAVVVEPVPDDCAALEGSRLDPVRATAIVGGLRVAVHVGAARRPVARPSRVIVLDLVHNMRIHLQTEVFCNQAGTIV